MNKSGTIQSGTIVLLVISRGSTLRPPYFTCVIITITNGGTWSIEF